MPPKRLACGDDKCVYDIGPENCPTPNYDHVYIIYKKRKNLNKGIGSELLEKLSNVDPNEDFTTYKQEKCAPTESESNKYFSVVGPLDYESGYFQRNSGISLESSDYITIDHVINLINANISLADGLIFQNDPDGGNIVVDANGVARLIDYDGASYWSDIQSAFVHNNTNPFDPNRRQMVPPQYLGDAGIPDLLGKLNAYYNEKEDIHKGDGLREWIIDNRYKLALIGFLSHRFIFKIINIILTIYRLEITTIKDILGIRDALEWFRQLSGADKLKLLKKHLDLLNPRFGLTYSVIEAICTWLSDSTVRPCDEEGMRNILETEVLRYGGTIAKTIIDSKCKTIPTNKRASESRKRRASRSGSSSSVYEAKRPKQQAGSGRKTRRRTRVSRRQRARYLGVQQPCGLNHI